MMAVSGIERFPVNKRVIAGLFVPALGGRITDTYIERTPIRLGKKFEAIDLKPKENMHAQPAEG